MRQTFHFIIAMFIVSITSTSVLGQDYVMTLKPAQKQKILSYAKKHNSNGIQKYVHMDFTNYVAPSTRRYAIECTKDSAIVLNGLSYGTKFIDSSGGNTSDNLYSVIIKPETDTIRMLVLNETTNKITAADVKKDLQALLAKK